MNITRQSDRHPVLHLIYIFFKPKKSEELVFIVMYHVQKKIHTISKIIV